MRETTHGREVEKTCVQTIHIQVSLHQPPCAAVARSSLKHRPDRGSDMLTAMADNMPADSGMEDELMGESGPGARQKLVRRLWR